MDGMGSDCVGLDGLVRMIEIKKAEVLQMLVFGC